MSLVTGHHYFVCKPHVQLKKNPGVGPSVNHLLLGDWLKFLGDQDNGWAKVRCRGDTGWLKTSDFSETRGLEVNFIDIGQGDGCHVVTPEDEVILIDAGVGDNMNRFLSWRYNLRSRNVARAADFNSNEAVKDPWKIDHVVISHPDNDHYFGFLDVFSNPKLSFDRIWHNGIIERPQSEDDASLWYPDDLGGYVRGSTSYLWDVAFTSTRVKEIVRAHPNSRKQLMRTLRACLSNSPSVSFKALTKPLDALGRPKFFGPFDAQHSTSLEVLGPLTEKVTHGGQTRQCLRKLGDEGVTKNGNSVILKLRYGKLEVMLGGDLNKQSQDFLLRSYTSVAWNASTLDKKIARLEARGDTISTADQTKLDNARRLRTKLIEEARQTFQCDVAKACHHGSAHFVDSFLSALNAVVTVISSGDDENYSHPRPDALGTIGKHGRGHRPLIFSTELARSTREFTNVIDYLDDLRRYEAALAVERDPDEQRRIQKEMEDRRDRNVAVYGMITLRALGDQVIIAQKLERPDERKNSLGKWDIYELQMNPNTGLLEYTGH